jgi:hypothetical protein
MMAKPGTVRATLPAWPAIAGLAVVLVCTTALLAALFLVDPAGCPFYPQCLFHRLTGWNCPGCGSLRGMHQLLHGHLLTALRCNAPLMLSLPLAAFYSLRQFSRWRAGRPVTFPAIRPGAMLLFVGALAVFTIVRNIPCAPFIYLSPP